MFTNSYKNITQQTTFSEGTLCVTQVAFYNTSISTGDHAAVAIKGKITVKAPYLPTDSHFENVSGVKVDEAFIEYNDQLCSNLKGYDGTSSGGNNDTDSDML